MCAVLLQEGWQQQEATARDQQPQNPLLQYHLCKEEATRQLTYPDLIYSFLLFYSLSRLERVALAIAATLVVQCAKQAHA